MQENLPRTVGALRRAGYRVKPVKEEMRDNLIRRIKAGGNWMPGIFGYEETVLKQLEHALLSRHDILLLGLRGQGKTRLLRQLVNLLDPHIPILAGSEVNDDPFRPISHRGRALLAEQGDEAPLDWLPRESRYSEKLATPDVSMADLIGDIDPVKAINQRLSYSHEEAIQFGLIPRANRGLFVINELPDLQARIQVGLLNILEERDFQIRGFRVRMPLDVFLAFSANPEDYTNRGNIITPLKDRIDSQIITHYPKDLETAMAITSQEAALGRAGGEEGMEVSIPRPLREIVEQIAFEARSDKDYVDPKSGVSARLSISALENLASAAEARALRAGSPAAGARLIDLESVVPAITGKVELVYAGEQEGPQNIARALVGKAVKSVFLRYFRDPYNKREKNPEDNPYHPVVSWFESGQTLTLSDRDDEAAAEKALAGVPQIEATVKKTLADKTSWGREDLPRLVLFELFLEGLHQTGRLGKETLAEGLVYKDMVSDILQRR